MSDLKDKLNKYELYDQLFSTPGLKLVFDISSLWKRIGDATSDFKIGVAHCPVKRWEGYIDHKGQPVPPLRRDFKFMLVSPVEDNFEASVWEEDSLEKWKSHKHCLNVARSGAGVSGSELAEPYFVYVCFK